MFKLMIVDDELLMRIGMRNMIDWETHGFTLAGEASNGREALDLARRVQPDLIITDIKMPLMDGLEFIREASNLLKHCKYVILSYFDEFSYATEAMRLGAIDYLIKHEITPERLAHLLTDVRQRLSEDGRQASIVEPSSTVTASLTHLKENLFKDMLSGLLDVDEAMRRADQLHVQLRFDELRVIKFRIDGFDAVRQKYVEKDEKLLRFSVRNILEEIIPSKWSKEIVIENSSDYMLIVNTTSEESAMTEMEALCRTVQQAMKDFMNISLSVGVSSVVEDWKSLRIAYQEADHALRYRFFSGTGRILLFERISSERDSRKSESLLSESEDLEHLFRTTLMSCNEEKLETILQDFRHSLVVKQANERDVREFYIWLIEIISTEMSHLSRFQMEECDRLPYEAVLSAETWDEVHHIVLHYARQCMAADSHMQGKSYADQAADLIHRYYAEDISLLSVASQINVNPSYLSRVFKREKGENFVSFLTRVRIERAKSLLENGNYKISEVADKVGYRNYPYFSRIFKKVVGMSPEEYRG